MGAVEDTEMQVKFSHVRHDFSQCSHYIMYKEKTETRSMVLDDRLAIIRHSVQKFGNMRKEGRGRLSLSSTPIRTTARYFSSCTQPHGKQPIRRRKCIVCSRVAVRPKKCIDTLYDCVKCGVSLYIDGCFINIILRTVFE